MTSSNLRCLICLIVCLTCQRGQSESPQFSTDANRLGYLDHPCDPYYVGTGFPKLTSPQWVGEPGVEAVIVLAIDDMRDPQKYEAYLRPILKRLKKIDGRAPVSIMTNKVDPQNEQLQEWLKEGLSIECHTIDHPCPLLQGGDFAKAKSTYDRCVDLMNDIPGNKPVAFRMPCCDSLNTPSPRFFREIFNSRTSKQNYLSIDSSVFNVFTSQDKDLPGDMLVEQDGTPRFQKYIPFPSFVNKIENYPYPYLIADHCWQFPCVVPSDWEAQNLHKPNNPKTVEDLKAALDLTVIKQGVFNFVFHPHGWIRSEQVVELIDHAVAKHGNKVKFLTFQEANQHLTKNLLGDVSLREGKSHSDNGIRVLDVNNDGFMDVIIANDQEKICRIWNSKNRTWSKIEFPFSFTTTENEKLIPVRFAVLPEDKVVCFGFLDDRLQAWSFEQNKWIRRDGFAKSLLTISGKPNEASEWRKIDSMFCDLNGDGVSEFLSTSSSKTSRSIMVWDSAQAKWLPLPFSMPKSKTLPTQPSLNPLRDTGTRLVDINEDGKLDVVFSDEKSFGVYLFVDLKIGWEKLLEGVRGKGKPSIPMISRNGTNNGAFFHSRQLWVQNEDTNRLPDLVQRMSLDDMLKTGSVKTPQKGNNTHSKNAGQPKAKSPQESLRSIKTRPELVVELVAAEPLIADPVAFDWAPDGSLWVVEMGDYPLGVYAEGKTGGRIQHLFDKNKDGIYDHAETFLEDIPFPTGIKAWKDGVIITAAPKIFFARDTNGDGKSDERKTLFKGFGKGNQQHRLNGLRWGLDGYLHVANGDSGGTITSFLKIKSLELRGHDLKIRDDGSMKLTAGQTQFGRNRDDWGNWIGGNNSNPMWQYVVGDRVPVSDQPGAAPVFPISKTLERFNDVGRANRFTSACSPMFYRDNLLGEEFYGNAFICEPVHNLVHREVVTQDGLYLHSKRAPDEQRSEFLASSDSWFRPTMIRTGPDGALWISDMYRLVIEHPEWIPVETQQQLDLRSGHDKGRIYRVYRRDKRPSMPDLQKSKPEELATMLKSSNGTLRDMVHQMLVWKPDLSLIDVLRKMATDQKVSPQARVQIMSVLPTLEIAKLETGMGRREFAEFEKSRAAMLKAVLEDKDPEIRAHAIGYYHSFGIYYDEESRTSIDNLRDPDPRVQLKLIEIYFDRRKMDTGEHELIIEDSYHGVRLSRLIVDNIDHPRLFKRAVSYIDAKNLRGAATCDWIRFDAAQLRQYIRALMHAMSDSKYPPRSIEEDILRRSLFDKRFKDERIRLTKLKIVLDEIPRRKLSREIARELRMEFSRQRAIVAFDDNPVADRLLAIDILGTPWQSSEDRSLLLGMLSSSNTPEIQIRAIEAIGKSKNEDIFGELLANWNQTTPKVRNQILKVILSNRAWTPHLVIAFEKKLLSPSILNAAQREQLRNSLDEPLQKRLAEIAAFPSSFDREVLIKDYIEQLKKPGDANVGKAIFAKHCSACHQLEGQGKMVGPDLAALSNKSTESLLMAILDPNQAVEQKYVNYLVETNRGLQHSGVLVQESDQNIALLTAEGKQVEVPRSQIESLSSTSKSFMPEGIEKDIDPKAMADLIAYLQSTFTAHKTFPNSKPELIKADKDGNLLLTASKARIFGPSIVFEQKYRNLGWWSNRKDHAVWTVNADKPGKYRVVLHYACDPNAANNRLVIALANKQMLEFKVVSTGSWDKYVDAGIGEVTLPTGQSQLLVRSKGEIKGALIDLQEIKLIPK